MIVFTLSIRLLTSLAPDINPANYDFDHPSSLDFESVFQSLKTLREMKDTKIPVYSFITNAKVPGEYKTIKSKQFVILEGIFAFYDEVERSDKAN